MASRPKPWHRVKEFGAATAEPRGKVKNSDGLARALRRSVSPDASTSGPPPFRGRGGRRLVPARNSLTVAAQDPARQHLSRPAPPKRRPSAPSPPLPSSPFHS